MAYEGPGIYEHYKGKLYHVIGLVKHSELPEILVLYTPLYVSESGVQMTVRPYQNFIAELVINSPFDTGPRKITVRRFKKTRSN